MKKILVLSLMALIIAIVGVRPIYAQDFSFGAVRQDIPGLTNRGVTGAQPRNFALLNTPTNGATQPNASPIFDAVDVGVGDVNGDGFMDIVSVSDDTNAGFSNGTLVVFVGLGDGTFGLPLAVFLVSQPTSVAVSDIDLDGFADVAIGERVSGLNPGGVEVYGGVTLANFFQTGGLILDTFTTFLPSDANAGDYDVVSVAFGRLNDDAFQDIVALESTTSGGGPGIGQIEQAFSNSLTASYMDFSTTTPLPLLGTVGNFPSPRAITTGISNLPEDAQTATFIPVDADVDVFAATTSGIEVYENQSPNPAPQTPTFVKPLNVNGATINFLQAGSNPVGVVVADVNSDNLPDVLALNRGSGTVSTFLASAATTGGYSSPRTSLVGANPVSLSLLNFDGDGKPDIVVANSSAGTFGLGNVVVLTGTGTGAFAGPTAANTFFAINPTSVAVGQFDQASQTDDIIISEFDDPIATGSTGGVIFLSAAQGYGPVILKLITAVSLAADFDGTGGLNDIAVVEQNFGIVVVLLNVSSGAAPNVGLITVRDLFTQFNVTPTSATAFTNALTGLNDLAITDIGTPTANTGFGQIIVGNNDGTGNFADLRLFRQFVATPGATNITHGDFNNDGIDDLVYIDFGSNFAAVALNDGTNFFLQPQFRETGGFVPVSAAVADVNDDDNLDLVVLNQGAVVQGNQTIVSVLNGTGDGRLVPTGSLLQVPNYGLSLVGGLADIEANGVQRVVDFNNDGYPDFAVLSTRGAISSIGLFVPTMSLILNRPDAPGNFTVQPPVPLIDDTATGGGANANLQLEDSVGGPGLVSGRGGQTGAGIGLGGANYTLAVGDFNADGSPDLVATGTRLVSFGIPGLTPTTNVNFRSVIYLIGNETSGQVRVSRPQRTTPYAFPATTLDPLVAGGDTFVACATGNFAQLLNRVPDVVHLSLNGSLFIDANTSSILNHAPILTIRRADLNAPFPGGGRKVIITAGQTATIPVTGFDPDPGDRLSFSLVPPPTGEQPPSFVTIKDNGNNTATVMVNSGDINRGPGNATFRIAVQATDQAASGPGGRLPLIGREYFTLVVKPNTAPTIGAIPNQTVEAGKTASVQLSVSDKEGNTVTNSVKCDKGSFVTVNGTTLSIAPQAGDVGATTCTVTATDQFGLSSTSTFAVTVTAPNLPPTIQAIQNQTVTQGTTATVNVTTTDPNGQQGLRLTLPNAPSFVSISDNGNGTGTIRISPSLTDTQGGNVTVQVTDPGGLTATTTFSITVQKAVSIGAANYDTAGKQLFINGTGFGSSGAKVTINGQDVSSRIAGQSDSSITVKGGKKKLNLKAGPNQVTVTAGGVTSNTFVVTLLKNDE